MKLHLLILILVFSCSAFGQAKKPPKPIATPVKAEILKTVPTQRITVEKLNGDKITGLFVSGNPTQITVQFSGTDLQIKTEEVKVIWFGDAKPEVIEAPKLPEINYVELAIKSLKQLSAATDVGVNFQDYGRRLIDVKSQVEEYLLKIPESEAKNEIRMAMEAYADAGSVWNFTIQNRGYLFIDFEPAITLRPKYNLQTVKLGSLTLIERETALSTIWQAAKKHIDSAQNK